MLENKVFGPAGGWGTAAEPDIGLTWLGLYRLEREVSSPPVAAKKQRS